MLDPTRTRGPILRKVKIVSTQGTLLWPQRNILSGQTHRTGPSLYRFYFMAAIWMRKQRSSRDGICGRANTGERVLAGVGHKVKSVLHGRASQDVALVIFKKVKDHHGASVQQSGHDDVY